MGSLKTVEMIRQRIIDAEKSSKALYMGVWACAKFYLKPKFYGTPEWTEKRFFGLPASIKGREIYTAEQLYNLLTTKDSEITFWYLQVLFSLFEEFIKESCSVSCVKEKIDSSNRTQVEQFLLSEKPYAERKDGIKRVAPANANNIAELKLAKETRNCFTHNDSKVDQRWLAAYSGAKGSPSTLKIGDNLPTTLPDVEQWQILIRNICAKLVMEARSQSPATP